MRFKDISIEEVNPYHFNVVCCAEKSHYVIAKLHYEKNDGFFRFESIGTRYLEINEPYLNQWLLQFCRLKEIEYLAEEGK